MKSSIFDFTLKDLEECLVSKGFKKFNATQVFEGIYKKRVHDFDDISNISKDLKKFLSDNYEIRYFDVLDSLRSEDTNKYLLDVNGSSIECVLMKHDYANSICVSTQVGCNMGCAFCESGKLKKVRNLTAGEIVLQLLTIERLEDIRIGNVVVMGIGEPFDNYDNLVNALDILTSPKGIDLGSRKITVSTCGIVPKIRDFANLKSQVNLAISLHAPNDEIRNKLMPINKAYRLNDLFDSINYYISKTNRRVTIEYILLKDINDSDECALELSRLLKGKLVYVNLIPYNSTSSSEFSRTSKDRIKKFYDILKSNGIEVIIRREMGKGIKGACGQLKASYDLK
jgi:23S rRNA (adenine2503-C2)-methyltransferase